MNSYKPRIEDIRIEAYSQAYAKKVFLQYEPYSICICGSGKKFRFCCQKLKEKSKAWDITLKEVTTMIYKSRLKAKMEAVKDKTNKQELT